MKFSGLMTIGIMGGIGFGSLGTAPFLKSAPTMSLRGQNVVVSPPQWENQASNLRVGDTVPPAGGELNSPPTEEQSVESVLRDKIARLERGRAFLNEVEEYTAKIRKQEVVQNVLLDEQTILIKIRHKPFSVYLDWVAGEAGREVLFVEGQNNGRMIAHDGGWKARLPAFSLLPESRLAMRDARYPVTSAGLLSLLELMLDLNRQDLARSTVASSLVSSEQFEGRDTDRFTVVYKSRSESPVYRKSITWIDREWNIPVHSRHFEWPRSEIAGTEEEFDTVEKLDDATLIEEYSFTDLDFRPGLSDEDFDRANQRYRFR